MAVQSSVDRRVFGCLYDKGPWKDFEFVDDYADLYPNATVGETLAYAAVNNDRKLLNELDPGRIFNVNDYLFYQDSMLVIWQLIWKTLTITMQVEVRNCVRGTTRSPDATKERFRDGDGRGLWKYLLFHRKRELSMSKDKLLTALQDLNWNSLNPPCLHAYRTHVTNLIMAADVVGLQFDQNVLKHRIFNGFPANFQDAFMSIRENEQVWDVETLGAIFARFERRCRIRGYPVTPADARRKPGSLINSLGFPTASTRVHEKKKNGGKKKKTKELCRRFLRGNCPDGDSCRYTHGTSSTEVSVVSSKTGDGKKVCWSFRDTGKCKFGSNCKYSHSTKTTTSTEPTSSKSPSASVSVVETSTADVEAWIKHLGLNGIEINSTGSSSMSGKTILDSGANQSCLPAKELQNAYGVKRSRGSASLAVDGEQASIVATGRPKDGPMEGKLVNYITGLRQGVVATGILADELATRDSGILDLDDGSYVITNIKEIISKGFVKQQIATRDKNSSGLYYVTKQNSLLNNMDLVENTAPAGETGVEELLSGKTSKKNGSNVVHQRLLHTPLRVLKTGIKCGTITLGGKIDGMVCSQPSADSAEDCLLCFQNNAQSRKKPHGIQETPSKPWSTGVFDSSGVISPSSFAGNNLMTVFACALTGDFLVVCHDSRRKMAQQLSVAVRNRLKSLGLSSIYALRSDRLSDYLSERFSTTFSQLVGVQELQLTGGEASYQNGIAESLIKSIWKFSRAVLNGVSMPHRYWDVAIENFVVPIRRKLPTKVLSKIAGGKNLGFPSGVTSVSSVQLIRAFAGLPFKPISLRNVRIPFSLVVFKKRRPDTVVGRKFESKWLFGVFFGYELGLKTYLILGPNGKITVRDPTAVHFMEKYHGRRALAIFHGQRNRVGFTVSDSEKEDLSTSFIVPLSFPTPTSNSHAPLTTRRPSISGDAVDEPVVLTDDPGTTDDSTLSHNGASPGLLPPSAKKGLLPFLDNNHGEITVGNTLPSRTTRSGLSLDSSRINSLFINRFSHTVLSEGAGSQMESKVTLCTDLSLHKCFVMNTDSSWPACQKIPVTSVPVPRSVAEARASVFFVKAWKPAMIKELDRFEEFGVFEKRARHSLPANPSFVKLRWIFQVKSTASDNTVTGFKARLVAKGYLQRISRDFVESYAPSVLDSSELLFRALRARFGLPVRKIDAVSAYLQSSGLEKGIRLFCEEIPGFGGDREYVQEIIKPVYGLKQGGNLWYRSWSQSLLKVCDLKPTLKDPCVFFLRSSDKFIMLITKTDDSRITATPNVDLDDIVKRIAAEVKITNESGNFMFDGATVTEDNKKILTSMSGQVTKMKNAHSLNSDAKERMLPLSASHHADDDTSGEKLSSMTAYRSLVGSLRYIQQKGRPDIVHAVGVLSCFLSSARTGHMKALVGLAIHAVQQDRPMVFHKLQPPASFATPIPIASFADVSFAPDPSDRKSRGCDFIFLDESLLLWKSKKQTIVTNSTSQSETDEMARCIRLGMFVVDMLEEFGFQVTWNHFCDNESAVQMVYNMDVPSGSRHWGISLHYVREQIRLGRLTVVWTPDPLMVADLGTKVLPIKKFQRLSNVVMGYEPGWLVEVQRKAEEYRNFKKAMYDSVERYIDGPTIPHPINVGAINVKFV